MSKLCEGCVFSIGNPMLDFSAEVSSDFLARHSLRPHDAILGDDDNQNILEDLVASYDCEVTPGGAALNSIRYCQLLIGDSQKQACVFAGTTGTDHEAKTLLQYCQNENINAQFYQVQHKPTAKSAVCITGVNRSLCAYLGAANFYDSEKHLKTDEIWTLVENARIFYCTGFFLTVCPVALFLLAEQAANTGKIFCFNLSAEFICKSFKEKILQLLPLVDFLFGNEDEFREFSVSQDDSTDNVKNDIKEIGKRVSNMAKATKKKSPIVIITRGPHPSLVFQDGEILLENPVSEVNPGDFIGTSCAGDAFVGGFLASLAQGGNLEACLKLGASSAFYCIQKPGCTIDLKERDKILSL